MISASGVPPALLSAIRNSASPSRGQGLRGDLIDRRERGKLADEARHEPLDPLGASLDLEQHAVLIVEHIAAKRLLVGEPVHERPEPDALDGAAHTRSDPQAAATERRHGITPRP